MTIYKMTEIEVLQMQIDNLQAELDEMKKSAEAEGGPKYGDKVWTLGIEGAIVESTYRDSLMWRYKLATGSLHRTEAEATAYRDWLTSPRTQARRMVEMCDGFNLKGMYSIFYRKASSESVVIKDCSIDGSLRFLSIEQAQAAIDKLGEETINLALGIEEN